VPLHARHLAVAEILPDASQAPQMRRIPSASTSGMSRVHLGAEVWPVQLTHLALDVPCISVDLQEASGEFDRLLLGACLEDSKAADHFLGFRKRPVHGRELSFAKAHSHSFGRRPKPGVLNHNAFSGHFLYEFALARHELVAGYLALVLANTNHGKECQPSPLEPSWKDGVVYS